MKLGSALAFLAILFCSVSAWAGPPFQTDDPEPIDFRNYEFYTFASSDGTPLEMDTVGPAVEFNWGALPNVHLHIILPLAAIFPSNSPNYAPLGAGPSAFGFGDIETGIKYRFIQEANTQANNNRHHCPSFLSFPRCRRRSWIGCWKNLVQGSHLGAKEFRTLDHLRRWGRNAFQPRRRLSQFPLRWLAGAARHWQEVDAGHRGFLSRTGRSGDAANQGRGAAGFRWLLQIPRSRISIALLLRPHHRRPKRELRIPRPLLDLGP